MVSSKVFHISRLGGGIPGWCGKEIFMTARHCSGRAEDRRRIDRLVIGGIYFHPQRVLIAAHIIGK